MAVAGSALKTCSKCSIPKTQHCFNKRRPECKTCQSEYRVSYGERNRDQLNAQAADYRSANRGILATKERQRYASLTVEDRRDYNRAYALKHEYGITVEQYEAILEAQGGVCAICGRTRGDKMLAVDHDHDTGEVRGLLCVRCNTALGTFGDNEAGITRVLDYLRRST